MRIKRWLASAAAVLLVAALAGCHSENNGAVVQGSEFTGTVEQAGEACILVAIDETEYIYQTCVQKAWVSLDTEDGGDMQFQVGDRVTVVYDGTVLETGPGQIPNVYSITLTNTASSADR